MMVIYFCKIYIKEHHAVHVHMLVQTKAIEFNIMFNQTSRFFFSFINIDSTTQGFCIRVPLNAYDNVLAFALYTWLCFVCNCPLFCVIC